MLPVLVLTVPTLRWLTPVGSGRRHRRAEVVDDDDDKKDNKVMSGIMLAAKEDDYLKNDLRITASRV